MNKGAITNSKNEKDTKCFQYAITIALNYNKIKKNICKIQKKLNREIQIFHLTKQTGQILNKKILQLLLMSYLYNTTVKK